jgi:ribosomal protein S27E
MPSESEARCDVCDAVLVRALSRSGEGAFVDAAVALQPFDVLACPDGHEMRYPYTGWSNEVRDGILDALPIAVVAPLHALRCRACEEPLDRDAAEPGEVSVRVALSQASPLLAIVHVPLLRCEHCGVEQVVFSDDLGSDLVDAVDAALEDAGVEP